jgi:hypothetical protein
MSAGLLLLLLPLLGCLLMMLFMHRGMNHGGSHDDDRLGLTDDELRTRRDQIDAELDRRRDAEGASQQ